MLHKSLRSTTCWSDGVLDSGLAPTATEAASGAALGDRSLPCRLWRRLASALHSIRNLWTCEGRAKEVFGHTDSGGRQDREILSQMRCTTQHRRPTRPTLALTPHPHYARACSHRKTWHSFASERALHAVEYVGITPASCSRSPLPTDRSSNDGAQWGNAAASFTVTTHAKRLAEGHLCMHIAAGMLGR